MELWLWSADWTWWGGSSLALPKPNIACAWIAQCSPVTGLPICPLIGRFCVSSSMTGLPICPLIGRFGGSWICDWLTITMYSSHHYFVYISDLHCWRRTLARTRNSRSFDWRFQRDGLSSSHGLFSVSVLRWRGGVSNVTTRWFLSAMVVLSNGYIPFIRCKRQVNVLCLKAYGLACVQAALRYGRCKFGPLLLHRDTFLGRLATWGPSFFLHELQIQWTSFLYC